MNACFKEALAERDADGWGSLLRQHRCRLPARLLPLPFLKNRHRPGRAMPSVAADCLLDPITAERACDQLVSVVQSGGNTVHFADECAGSTAHHAKSNSHERPKIFRLLWSLVPASAKSSNALSVTRMMWSRMKVAPSRAPSSGCLRQHSHSSTAQPSKSFAASLEKIALKSTCPSPRERICQHDQPRVDSRHRRPVWRSD